MNLYIEKIHEDEYGQLYVLKDEKGQELNRHFCSNWRWAKDDLLRGHPEWNKASIIKRF